MKQESLGLSVLSLCFRFSPIYTSTSVLITTREGSPSPPPSSSPPPSLPLPPPLSLPFSPFSTSFFFFSVGDEPQEGQAHTFPFLDSQCLTHHRCSIRSLNELVNHSIPINRDQAQIYIHLLCTNHGKVITRIDEDFGLKNSTNCGFNEFGSGFSSRALCPGTSHFNSRSCLYKADTITVPHLSHYVFYVFICVLVFLLMPHCKFREGSPHPLRSLFYHQLLSPAPRTEGPDVCLLSEGPYSCSEMLIGAACIPRPV